MENLTLSAALNELDSKYISDNVEGEVEVVKHVRLALGVLVVAPLNLLAVELFQQDNKLHTILKVFLEIVHAKFPLC